MRSSVYTRLKSVVSNAAADSLGHDDEKWDWVIFNVFMYSTRLMYHSSFTHDKIKRCDITITILASGGKRQTISA